MQWKLLKGDCSNSRSVGQRCTTPSTHGWSPSGCFSFNRKGPVLGLRCSSCKKTLCVACLASLQKIEEGSDCGEENWQLVPSKQRKPVVVREKEKIDTSTSLVDALCQRRELPEKVRFLALRKASEVRQGQELLAIPAQEAPF